MARPTTTHARAADWPEQLAALIEARRATPFAWGTQDCLSFACDVVQQLLGTDPLAAWRGRYATEAEADDILAPFGGLERFVAMRMEAVGVPDCDPRYVQRGDVVLLRVANDFTCGVVTGTLVAATGLDGLQFVPRRLIERAWAV